MKTMVRGVVGLFLALVVASSQAAYSQLFVFGDSLADSGNNSIVLGGVTTPDTAITSNSFIPLYPYASHNYSNGPEWGDYLAGSLGVPFTPSLAGGTNYAYGGATTGPAGGGWPFSVRDQVGQFLGAYGGVAPASALYMLEGGGNNVRAALEAVAGGADPTVTAAITVNNYVTDMLTMVAQLQGSGVNHLIIWNAPNVGLAPAVRAAGPLAAGYASALADAMNDALLAAAPYLAGSIFDVYDLVTDATLHPATYGLTNTADACGADPACTPGSYLFWDGLHVTTAVNQIIAGQLLVMAVPSVGTLWLLLVGVVLVWGMRRRHLRVVR